MLAPASAPFAAWGDMSQVLPGEGWDATTCVRSVGYFCDTYDGPEKGASERRRGATRSAGWSDLISER